MFLQCENEASKRKRFHSIWNGQAVLYAISEEGMDQNVCPGLQESYYSTANLILCT